jgi:hypothetical protein
MNKSDVENCIQLCISVVNFEIGSSRHVDSCRNQKFSTDNAHAVNAGTLCHIVTYAICQQFHMPYYYY